MKQQQKKSSKSRSRSKSVEKQKYKVSYQEYLLQRKNKRETIKKTYIWQFNSDSEEYTKDLEMMKVKRQKERQMIEEQTRKEEDELRKSKLEAIMKGEHLNKVIGTRSQERELAPPESEQNSSYSDSESDDSFAEKVRKINEEQQKKKDDESGVVIGPAPLLYDNKNLQNRTNYGNSLLPGEGAAIAYYIQSGKRIPRRGEVGLTSEDIEKYEGLGYVMSGSKHRKMNAVRQRKEMQILNAEQGKALMIFNYEQKVKREKQIIDELQRQLKNKKNNVE